MALDFYRDGGEILFDFGPSLKLVVDQEKRIKGANLSWRAHREATKMLFNGRWERGHEIMEDILEQAGGGMMKYRMMVEDGYVSMGKERTQMAITKLLSRLEGDGDEDHSMSSDSNQAEQFQVLSTIQDKIVNELSKWEEEWKGGVLGKGLGENTDERGQSSSGRREGENENRHASNKWFEAERDPKPIFVKQDTGGRSSLGHIPEKRTTQVGELEKEAFLLTKELEERRRVQKERHERALEGKSPTDGWDQKLVEWDQDLVSQINNVKVSVCTLREKRKEGKGEMEERVTAVLNGVWNHMISLDISVRSRASNKINAEEGTEVTTKPTETTHITMAGPVQTPRDGWNEWGEYFACATIDNGRWAQNHRKNLELNKIFCGA